jgi:drug/metabolite transporter (DMT)-like permease
MSIKIFTIKINSRLQPIIGLILAISAVSTASILIRFAQDSYPSLFIAAARLGLASLFLLPFFIKRNKSFLLLLNKRDIILLVLSGGFLAMHFASWITSLEFTNVISSVVLVTTTPIWVSLLSYLFFKERLKPIFYMGLVISFLGVAIIAWGDEGFGITIFREAIRFKKILTGTTLAGNALALIGAMCAAGYIVCGKKLREKLDNLTYVFLIYSCASILLILVLILKQPSPINIIQPAIGWVFLVAIIPQLIGHSLINWSLDKLPASFVALSLLGEPIGSTLLAMIILGEQPSALQVMGSFLIIVGLVIAARPETKDVN